jgi:NADH:ubiquinone oxidoreductase subunit C
MGEKATRNTSGLLQHAALLKSETEEKVNRAIDTLKRSKTKKINFKTVSELSGISTTTLYNNPALRERIESLRAVKQLPAQEAVAPDLSARDRERELRQEIQKLKEEKHMLVVQLVELEYLRQENRQLKALLSQKRLE